MSRKRTILTWALSITLTLFAASVVIQLVDDVGAPILLDPENKLPLPPPPKSMYQMPQESLPSPTPIGDPEVNQTDDHLPPTTEAIPPYIRSMIRTLDKKEKPHVHDPPTNPPK